MRSTTNYKISLLDLERAISRQCPIDKEAEKKLSLVKQSSHKNKGLARSLFVFFALRLGYDRIDICSFMDMTEDEYQARSESVGGMYAEGREHFMNMKGSYQREDVENSSLYFFRKYLLIRNYFTIHYGVPV